MGKLAKILTVMERIADVLESLADVLRAFDFDKAAKLMDRLADELGDDDDDPIE